MRSFVDAQGRLLYRGDAPSDAKLARIAKAGGVELDWPADVPPGTRWDGQAWVPLPPVVPAPAPVDPNVKLLAAAALAIDSGQKLDPDNRAALGKLALAQAAPVDAAASASVIEGG